MSLNEKKPIRLVNRTKYFIPDKDKTHVTFYSPKSFSFGRQKVESYETRLYYEFKRSQELGGQTFFYTLTYNDAHVPHYMGHSCFDYEDLRYLLCGGFRKYLLRKYGTMFRYFVGAELGDGKGVRGEHNNPHYHILFFLRPSDVPVYVPYIHEEVVGYYQRRSKYHSKGDPKIKKIHDKKLVPYMKITAKEFRSVLRKYWQGFDEDEGFRDFREARFGICQEGRFNLGVVTDYRAIAYVAKYATKDASLVKHEFQIRQDAAFQFEQEYKDSFKSYADFLHTRIYYLYNIPCNARHTEYVWTDKELCWRLVPDLCKSYTLFEDWLPSWIADCTKGIIARCGLHQDYIDFVKAKTDEYVHNCLSEFRNRYSNKVRISQEVGSNAIDDVDVLNPVLKVPSGDGYKSRNLGLYLFRKLYSEIYTDSRGHCVRVLNSLGIQYKLHTLDKQISNMKVKAKCFVDLVLNDEELYNKVYCSDLNTDVTMSYDVFRKRYYSLVERFTLNEILNRYALYKLIYEERFIKNDFEGFRRFGVDSFPDFRTDYELFLGSSVGFVRRSSDRLTRFLSLDDKDYTSYSLLPYFNRFIVLFDLFDLCSDYFFVSADDKAQSEAEEARKTRILHKRNELKDLFNLINSKL